eukprot:6048585-Lingulodinium_polyedra.AAC.1
MCIRDRVAEEAPGVAVRLDAIELREPVEMQDLVRPKRPAAAGRGVEVVRVRLLYGVRQLEIAQVGHALLTPTLPSDRDRPRR